MEEMQLIDDSFYVKNQKWGTWQSVDKDGNNLVTSLDKEVCISATRFALKGKQEGFENSNTYTSTVDGKL